MRNFIKKIKDFLRKIFSKNKIEMLEESKEDSLNNNATIEKINYQKKKDEFFEIYNEIKSGKYDLNKLTKEQSKQIIDILSSEIELKKEKLNNNITELNILKTDNRIEEKNRILNLYKEVKDANIDLSQVDEEDLLKIRKLMLEETKIQDEKLEREIMLLLQLANNN